MVVKMKKLHVLLPAMERESLLNDLADVGVVHIEERVEENHSQDLERMGASIKRYRKVMNFLESRAHESSSSTSTVVSRDDAASIVEKFENLEQQRDAAQQRIIALRKDVAILAPWGNFDPQLIEKLKKREIRVRFFEIGAKKFTRLDLSGISHAVVHADTKIKFIVFDRGETSFIDADDVNLPARALESLQKEIEQLEKSMENIDSELSALVPVRGVIAKAVEKMEQDERFERARCSCEAGAGGTVLLLTGWLPASHESNLRALFTDRTVWFEVVQPAPQDSVPILLKNNMLVDKFETVIKLFQLPNYREIDPTPLVAPFYAIFFGTCLGDAGYGIIILLASFIAYIKIPHALRRYAIFGLILGFFTLFMGIVNSGTVFGIAIRENQEVRFFGFLSRFTFIKEGQTINPFNFALLLGVLQINVGIATNFVNRILFVSFKHSIPAIAKLFLIDSLIILFLALYQNYAPLKPYVVIAIPGVILGILLMTYSVLVAGMEQLMDNRMVSFVLKLYFILSGAIGDILSYIRLFALGLSSGILGYVINVIGMQMTGIKYVGWIVGILFLIVGHGVNLLLSGLSSFVHPLRLTFVEFYNNLEFKGGGKDYNPLKKTI